jgi:hypothetical protein
MSLSTNHDTNERRSDVMLDHLTSHITVRRVLRKMRGRTHSCLMSSDKGYWVVKLNSAANRRLLINEWIATILFQHLGIRTPHAGLISVPYDLLPACGCDISECTIQADKPQLHFGSLYPGCPDHTSVYDFLPDSMLATVLNSEDFVGALVLDLWTGSIERRQCVFFREGGKYDTGQTSPKYIASMIDHGGAFNGRHWTFPIGGNAPSYIRPSVYHTVRGWRDLSRWIEAIREFPLGVIEHAANSIPSEWKEGDKRALDIMLETLLSRKLLVPGLIVSSARQTSLFPNWTSVI